MPSFIRFDWALKNILRAKANFVILEGFLSELLKIDIKIKKILESESNKEREDQKLNRVDLLAEDSNGKLLLFEVQVSSEVDYFHRIVFGTSRLVSEYLDSGDSYGNIKKVITIHILYFELGQGEDYLYKGITEFRGVHKKNDILEPSDHQKKFFHIDHVHEIFPEHYLIRLNRFDEVMRDKFDEWIYFLKKSQIKPRFSAKGLNEAKKRLDELGLKGQARIDYRAFLKRQHDAASEALNIEAERQWKEELKARVAEQAEALLQSKKELQKKDKTIFKAEEDKRKAEEDKRKAEEDKRKAEEDKRKAEEDKRKAEEELSLEKAHTTKALALNMLKQNLPLETIKQVTHLSQNELEKIRKALSPKK